MNEAQNLKTFVVNLERSTERRADMAKKLEALKVPFEFFSAVDGRAQKHPLFDRYDRHLALIRYGFELAPGELGCYASHFLLWQRCIEEDEPVLILEDDIDFASNFRSAVDLVAQKVNKFGLLRLSAHKPRKFAVCEQAANGLTIIRFKRGPHGTSSYAVSPSAALKLVQAAQVWFEPVDVHIDRFWKHGVGSYGIMPFPVQHLAMSATDSEIWQGVQRGSRSAEFRRQSRFIRMRENVSRFISNIPYVGRWKSWAE